MVGGLKGWGEVGGWWKGGYLLRGVEGWHCCPLMAC